MNAEAEEHQSKKIKNEKKQRRMSAHFCYNVRNQIKIIKQTKGR